MKHLYKFVALFFLFFCSLFFFGQSIPSVSITSTTASSLQDSTFPIMYLQDGNYTINTLHGYSSEMPIGKIRESITPLDNSKTFSVKIQQNESKIKKITYELRDIANHKVLETNSYMSFDSDGKYLTSKITLNQALDTSTEYDMQITLTTNVSKKIHFYTRIKYYTNDFFLQQKLDFVSSFHNATLDPQSGFNISSYLEATTNEDTTLANVDIHSSKKMIQWNNLKPTIITTIVPTIKEINIETAAIYQDYFVQIGSGDNFETYHVKENYRVRFSGNRIYLLNFNRTMESLFDPDLISVKKSELKIGISNADDLNITTADKDKKMAFVRNGSLWYYDLSKKKLNCVFSYAKNKKDYLRDEYDQHDIQILNLEKDGTMSFMVYGYMNCGDYEGRVGILLYDYDAKTNQITERVYIPLETSFQQLNQDLGTFNYVNTKNIFYFSLNDIVYAYNISSKRYTILTENATRDHFSMLKAAKCFVWSTTDKNGFVNQITILDLNTSKELTIQSPDNESVVVLGTIDANIVYGFVRNSDIYEDSTGDVVKPAYILKISDCKGNILRDYQSKNRYVESASVDGNVIHLKRSKKVNGHFRSATSDTIMNQMAEEKTSIGLTTRLTNKMLTEKYISLPAGYVMERMPEVSSTKNVMVTDNTTLHFSNKDISTSIKYYVCANGTITKSYTSAAKAISEAYKEMGTVIDNKSHIVWERGGKFISKKLSTISYPSDTSSSIKACTQMLLQAAQVTTTTSELSGKSILSMLQKHLEYPVSLAGCSLDDVLYFVSRECPVIGMLDSNHAVLITAYTSSTVSWMDPQTRKSKTVSIHVAENMFKNAGYKFVSYISD